jgi:hypothetical protein
MPLDRGDRAIIEAVVHDLNNIFCGLSGNLELLENANAKANAPPNLLIERAIQFTDRGIAALKTLSALSTNRNIAAE